jgi:hypothetical protein
MLCNQMASKGPADTPQGPGQPTTTASADVAAHHGPPTDR